MGSWAGSTQTAPDLWDSPGLCQLCPFLSIGGLSKIDVKWTKMVPVQESLWLFLQNLIESGFTHTHSLSLFLSQSPSLPPSPVNGGKMQKYGPWVGYQSANVTG